MLDFFTAKLYEDFQYRNPYNAARRVTGYLTAFYLFFALSLLVPVVKYFNYKYLNLHINGWFIFAAIAVLAVVLYNIVYRRLFNTNRIETMVRRYEHILMPALILYFGLFFSIPMFLYIYSIMDQWLNDSSMFNMVFNN
ncbi:hypothetical protein [Pseudobacter ginsenosidimutans]|uniref:Uncharacterized protein n=1 Tax=Pseudobacter ginsenosidimutans TaxID=661488 RepID=A0A4Q7N445_9BACT|nr:hypothetical protein [Pseudobacter ginsenosidimutans]QEC44299.1 hypothetical protein FSB84_22440 [Pseudobacter ginsenosidimutans]RZS75759.1 hypothetical protein EV199_1632 [Pseudobacter ginsenosidimutans]